MAEEVCAMCGKPSPGGAIHDYHVPAKVKAAAKPTPTLRTMRAGERVTFAIVVVLLAGALWWGGGSWVFGKHRAGDTAVYNNIAALSSCAELERLHDFYYGALKQGSGDISKWEGYSSATLDRAGDLRCAWVLT